MNRRALTWVEILVALVLLGVIAALTVPRFSRAAAAPADDSARLRDRLRVLRVAIERYYRDHHAYPAQFADGQAPACSPAAFEAQLTRFTDESGRVADAPDAVHRFGPYLRDGLPPCPLPAGARTGVHVTPGSQPPEPDPDSAAGWVYNCQTGQICANSAARDATGVIYAHY